MQMFVSAASSSDPWTYLLQYQVQDLDTGSWGTDEPKVLALIDRVMPFIPRTEPALCEVLRSTPIRPFGIDEARVLEELSRSSGELKFPRFQERMDFTLALRIHPMVESGNR